MKFTWVKIFILFFLMVDLNSQDYSLADINITTGDQTLTLPFLGGLKAPQFNSADLNLDGIDDLIIFDREGNVFLPLIRTANGDYNFRPDYRSLFPEVNTWVLFRDYDSDGIKDIFCGPVDIGLPGVEVYKGKIENDNLVYEKVLFPQYDFDLLYFPVGNIVTPVFVGVIDLPDIRDVDEDGDLDIVAFDPSGSTIYWYRNLSVEEGMGSDSLIYILEENCFGGVVESGFSEEVTLSPMPGECGSSFWEEDILADSRHSGSTVLFIDINGDTLSDMLLGDISYDGLVALINSGRTDEAHFTQQIKRFPQDSLNSADIELFLSAFYEDIDQDNVEELIVSVNDRFASQTSEHVWIYDVTHVENGKTFELSQKDFLENDMIYGGVHSFPCFFDHNGDGLMDILIGVGGKNTDGISRNPSLFLFENSGTADNPAYNLLDDDYLGMSEFKTTSSIFAPSIGDLDGDGDKDMLIGDNTGYMYYLENNSGNASDFSFRDPVYQAFNIKVGAHARPFIFDFNEDGLGDILLGEQNFNSNEIGIGSINYFQNVGMPGSPAFESDVNTTPNTGVFGLVNLKEEGFINNYSSPVLLDNGSEILLASGTENGNIYLYNTQSEVQDTFDLISKALGGIREGFRSGISFADIDNDQFYELAIGTSRGGLAIYNTDIRSEMSTSVKDIYSTEYLSIFPNPTSSMIQILNEDSTFEPKSLSIFNSAGLRLIHQDFKSTQIDVSALPEGIYIIRLTAQNDHRTVKFIKVEP